VNFILSKRNQEILFDGVAKRLVAGYRGSRLVSANLSGRCSRRFSAVMTNFSRSNQIPA